jgi:ComF family protein
MYFSRLAAFLRGLVEIVHEILFPKRCAACRKKGSYLCTDCEDRIPFASRFCEREILVPAPYAEHGVRQLIWLLKFRGVREIGEIFARWCYDALIEDLAEISAYREQGGKIVVLPVPLSEQRQRRRGFNQAEEIARCFVKLDPAIFRLETGNLVKLRDTPSQVSLRGRAARLTNLRGCFSIKNRRSFRGRTLILIDDVTTTGATLDEAARTLGRARPRKIIKIAAAG